MSNPLHRFSPYHALPSTTLLSNGHVQSSHMHATGLDTLAQGSHYAQQLLQQHVGVHNPHLARPGQQPKHRQHPYGPAARATGAAGPIRRRISRACDQCDQLRTKCDVSTLVPIASVSFLVTNADEMEGQRLTCLFPRVRPWLRVHPREEEEGQGLEEGPGRAGGGSGCGGRVFCKWRQVAFSQRRRRQPIRLKVGSPERRQRQGPQ